MFSYSNVLKNVRCHFKMTFKNAICRKPKRTSSDHGFEQTVKRANPSKNLISRANLSFENVHIVKNFLTFHVKILIFSELS